MRCPTIGLFLLCFGLWGVSPAASAEILAMLNYETRATDAPATPESATPARREGIMVIDVDPESPQRGQIVLDLPLDPQWLAHHIFYDHTMRRAYITFLQHSRLAILDLARVAYGLEWIDLPDCPFAEDVVFSDDHKNWYVSCMGSNQIIVGDARRNRVTNVYATAAPYPHGLSVHQGIDRLLTTSTLRGSDLAEPGEVIGISQLSTGKALGTIKVSDRPSPSGVAPVEVVFAPNSQPPTAYVTNMFGHSLWALQWQANTQDFRAQPLFDFKAHGYEVPLEIYFSPKGDQVYVTTAKPGHLHLFDLRKGLLQPRWITAIATAEGAHHVAFTRDGRYAVVQNALLNLPGMRDGEITVIDLSQRQVAARIDTLKRQGLVANSIVLLPRWHELGH